MAGRVVMRKVPNRGQTSLPAALVLPGGLAEAQAELRRVLLGGAYDEAVDGLADADVTDQ